ncbi:Reverse transcriptase domain-containing protein [Aphis craccivora]|uniref:Reverse transcriptase domain-containing protein n=1 Tax=Aphis craccivora TaxID=307492 RepID=A0A6G0ZK67_APHCR|nr:Reverse transcriptase domain-containing protein [Aphis craccivora]
MGTNEIVACPTWAAASPTKIKKIQILQNKFLRICLKAPWFMRDKQIHNDTRIPLLHDWIKTQLKNFHANLKTSDGARFFNLGTKTKNRRLKPRLPQDKSLSLRYRNWLANGKLDVDGVSNCNY